MGAGIKICGIPICKILKREQFTIHNQKKHQLRMRCFCKGCVANGQLCVYQSYDSSFIVKYVSNSN